MRGQLYKITSSKLGFGMKILINTVLYAWNLSRGGQVLSIIKEVFEMTNVFISFHARAPVCQVHVNKTGPKLACNHCVCLGSHVLVLLFENLQGFC